VIPIPISEARILGLKKNYNAGLESIDATVQFVIVNECPAPANISIKPNIVFEIGFGCCVC